LTSRIIDESTDRSETPLDVEESLRQACTTIESETLELISDMDGEESVQSCMVHKRLIVTTMLMLHSKWCINSGRAASAVKYLSWCRTQCREFARYLRSASCHPDSLSLDDIAIQVDGMLTMCYEQLATAFYLLGIRRKAEDHALLAVLKQKVLYTENFNRIMMQELIDLIERHTGEEPILYPTRTLMKVKAISTSVDKMSTQEISIECVENCNFDMDESTLRLNHSLCKSKNVLACELLHSVILLSFQLAIRYLTNFFYLVNRPKIMIRFVICLLIETNVMPTLAKSTHNSCQVQTKTMPIPWFLSASLQEKLALS